MKRLALLALLAGCISDQDAASALEEYCAHTEGKACDETATPSDCCEGSVCLAGACRKLVQDRCLFPDAGRVQTKGATCGCTADCINGACTSFKCQ